MKFDGWFADGVGYHSVEIMREGYVDDLEAMEGVQRVKFVADY